MGSPKKVEFASTHLDPIDSEAPAAYSGGSSAMSGGATPPASTWDTETGVCVLSG